MARSRCPREGCDGVAFEMIALRVERSASPLASVQCVRCGAVVGLLESPSVTGMLEQMCRKMGIQI